MIVLFSTELENIKNTSLWSLCSLSSYWILTLLSMELSIWASTLAGGGRGGVESDLMTNEGVLNLNKRRMITLWYCCKTITDC